MRFWEQLYVFSRRPSEGMEEARNQFVVLFLSRTLDPSALYNRTARELQIHNLFVFNKRRYGCGPVSISTDPLPLIASSQTDARGMRCIPDSLWAPLHQQYFVYFLPNRRRFPIQTLGYFWFRLVFTQCISKSAIISFSSSLFALNDTVDEFSSTASNNWSSRPRSNTQSSFWPIYKNN